MFCFTYFPLVGSPGSTVHGPSMGSMVQVGSLTYFVPDMADAVGVFEAATREYAQVDTWRNTSWVKLTMTHP